MTLQKSQSGRIKIDFGDCQFSYYICFNIPNRHVPSLYPYPIQVVPKYYPSTTQVYASLLDLGKTWVDLGYTLDTPWVELDYILGTKALSLPCQMLTASDKKTAIRFT